LLDAAGWTAGPDGVLRRGNRDLRFTLVTLDDPAWIAIARELADGWATLGARVTVAPTSQERLVSEFINPRAYEAALIGWDPGPDPDPYAGWHSSLRGQPGGNPANFADERSDELLVEGRVQPDPESRRTRYGLFQARFRELSPSVVLFAEAVRYAVNPAFQLSLPSTLPEDAARFSDVRRWHINTRRGAGP
jgi:peptide/nickel transport system substrate-binding protein